MLCPVLCVDNSSVSSVQLTYGDDVTVVCNHQHGYRTPQGEVNFTVSCQYDGHNTYLVNLTRCIGNTYLEHDICQ